MDNKMIFPCCGEAIKNGHKKKSHELQSVYDEHKKTCKDYKKWKIRLDREGDE